MVRFNRHGVKITYVHIDEYVMIFFDAEEKSHSLISPHYYCLIFLLIDRVVTKLFA